MKGVNLMAALFCKDSGRGGGIEIQLVDSDPAHGPHIALTSKYAGAALCLGEDEIEAVRQWCERIQGKNKEIDDLLNEACGVSDAT